MKKGRVGTTEVTTIFIFIFIYTRVYIDQLLVLQLLILAVHMMDVDQYGREWCSTQSRWIVWGHTDQQGWTHGGHPSVHQSSLSLSWTINAAATDRSSAFNKLNVPIALYNGICSTTMPRWVLLLLLLCM